MKSLRQIVDSILFAGMGSGQRPGDGSGMRWLGPLRGPIDRFLSGGARPDDPLYLSNRTLGQRLRMAVLIALPVAVIAGLVALALTQSAKTKPQAELSSAEVAKRTLTDLPKDIQVETNRDLTITNVTVEHGTPIQVVGKAKNNTDHVIRSAELVFDVTNDDGSQVGAVSTRLEHVLPNATAAFRFPIPQTDAAFVLVREVHVE